MLRADEFHKFVYIVQLQVGLEQNEALQTERASLATALRKLQAFKQNLLHTLQASDMVSPPCLLSASSLYQ